jgi:hypothetical protein
MATAIATTTNTNGVFGNYNSPGAYAHQRNAQYSNSASLFQDLKDRFNQAMAALPANSQAWFRSQLNHAIKAFQSNYPKLTKFAELPLCTAQSVFLTQILIDSTMQRQADLNWVIKIITNFRATQAMPIQVYRVSGTDVELKYLHPDGLYASWDGQHTALAFWVIACAILGEDAANVRVPVVIYDVSTKAEIRDNFVKNNTDEGKKLLDNIDVVQQQIYGVRIDGSTNPNWLAVEQKQRHLENAGLFLTAKKFNDTEQVGAISRVEDVMSDKYSPELVRQFCVYAQTVLSHNPRAINTKEAPIILGFLKMASNMNYSDTEIQNLANLCMHLFGADFDSDGIYWQRAEQAYLNWWNQTYGGQNWSNAPTRPRFNKDWINGGTFFWYQLSKSWKDTSGNAMPMPQLNIATGFVPTLKDLF